MPDRRRHRGPHPEDRALFSTAWLPSLRQAVSDLSWLQGHGYSAIASLKLVGDRFGLDRRQRTAVQRAACADDRRDARAARRVRPAAVRGRELWIDGFNVLITIESALAAGVLLRCRDGCLRDMASLHGSYRPVDETPPAVAALWSTLARLAPADCRVLLDRPVSNSGRLRAALETEAAGRVPPAVVELSDDVDRILRAAQTPTIVATADAGILDHCGPWFDLASEVVAAIAPDAAELALDPPLTA